MKIGKTTMGDTCVTKINNKRGSVSMEHRIFRMYLGNRDDEQRINDLLEKGWLVKEMQSVSADEEGCYTVVWIEKKYTD